MAEPDRIRDIYGTKQGKKEDNAKDRQIEWMRRRREKFFDNAPHLAAPEAGDHYEPYCEIDQQDARKEQAADKKIIVQRSDRRILQSMIAHEFIEELDRFSSIHGLDQTIAKQHVEQRAESQT